MFAEFTIDATISEKRSETDGSATYSKEGGVETHTEIGVSISYSST